MLFGDYWHRSDKGREEEIKSSWRAIGWNCIILWTSELDVFLENLEPGQQVLF